MTRQSHLVVLLTALCVLAGSGCASVQLQGRPIAPDTLALIHPGMTEEAVVALVGKPSRVQQRSSGRRVLLYEAVQTLIRRDPLFGRVDTRKHTRTLHVLIEQGRVLDHTLTEQTTTADEIDRTTPRYYPLYIPLPS